MTKICMNALAALALAGCSCSPEGSSAAADVPVTDSSSADTDTSKPEVQTAPTESQMLALGQLKTKEALEAKLKDSDSVKYKDVAAYRVPSMGPGYAFCGKVNSRNSFGGYTGFERFVGASDAAFLESEVSDFDSVWEQMCNPTLKGPAIWW